VIPAACEYARPTTVDEALAALTAGGEDPKVLAGGQSLIPLLRLRMSYPTTLVDLGRVDELRGIRDEGDAVVVGAMTTHHEVLTSPLILEHVPIVAEATALVADPAVRHRGTFGGSIAHADPAGDLPAVALALDAVMEIAGSSGRRSVPAAEFFVDYLQTAVGPDEVLVSVRLPKLGAGWGAHYAKFSRVAQAWAIVGVAALVQLRDGGIAQARVGLTHMASTPLRATATEAALAGADAAGDAVAAAAALAADGTSPATDIHADGEYRRHLARVLTRRALQAAVGA
jgi:carbon-monoxide dehydrogenase medium subunit